MIALACLLAIAAIVWLLVKDAEDRDYEAEAYRDLDDYATYRPELYDPEFTDWSDWDWPNYDDYRGSAA